MPGVLGTMAELLLRPWGIRRKHRRPAPRNPGHRHADGEPPLEEDEGWEVDPCQFIGAAAGALIASWILAKLKSSSSPQALSNSAQQGVGGFGLGSSVIPRIALSEFLRLLRAGAVTTVTYLADKPPAGALVMEVNLPSITDATVPGDLATVPCSAETLLLPGSHQKIFEEMQSCKGLHFECGDVASGDSSLNHLSLLIDAGTLIASLGSIWYLLKGNTSLFSGKNLDETSRKDVEQQVSVNFGDVAGMEETKEELREVIAFLRNPQDFYALGARPPMGLLLAGPSGTGKTLMARAVAGEAGVPFLYASAAAFVEVFVGQGAQRVRQFFENARSCAPCIVFLDEIDALGAARHASTSGGNQEYTQTLNQLLLELDGVESHADGQPLVLTMAATNRYDCLDEALVRPGRLDRIVMVPMPNLAERAATLGIHARKLCADGLDLQEIARWTDGYTGADLANLLNEAALLAARCGADAVRMRHVETIMSRPRPKQQRSQQEEPGDAAGITQAMAGMFAAAASMATGGRFSPQSPQQWPARDASSLD